MRAGRRRACHRHRVGAIPRARFRPPERRDEAGGPGRPSQCLPARRRERLRLSRHRPPGAAGGRQAVGRFQDSNHGKRPAGGSVEEGPNETGGAAAGQNQPLYAGSALNPWTIACYTWLKPQKMGAHMDWRLIAALASAGGSLCLVAVGAYAVMSANPAQPRKYAPPPSLLSANKAGTSAGRAPPCSLTPGPAAPPSPFAPSPLAIRI